MNRFIALLIILGIAFVSGWLFGNEIQPPRVQDLGFAVWLVGIAAAMVGGLVMAVSRG